MQSLRRVDSGRMARFISVRLPLAISQHSAGQWTHMIRRPECPRPFNTTTPMDEVELEKLSTRTLPEALEHYAHTEPLAPMFSYGGDTEISAREFYRATLRAARLLGKDSPPETVVGMLTAADTLVQAATEIGLMMAGLIVRAWTLRQDRRLTHPPSFSPHQWLRAKLLQRLQCIFFVPMTHTDSLSQSQPCLSSKSRYAHIWSK